MKPSTPVEIIREHLSREDMLLQLAEEAAELAQAALKLVRACTRTNPTPKTEQEAYEGLLEEVADVYVCLDVLGYDRSMSRMRTKIIAREKVERWARRLEEKYGN